MELGKVVQLYIVVVAQPLHESTAGALNPHSCRRVKLTMYPFGGCGS